jgi:chemotaxis response regulator CheB
VSEAVKKEYGGMVFVQNEATSITYEMPRAWVEDGLADAVASDEHLSECIIQEVKFMYEKALAISDGHPPVNGQNGSGRDSF